MGRRPRRDLRYIKAHNAYSAKPFVWTRSAESIIEAVNQAKAEPQHAD
jgi:hypothetical protein